MMKKVPVCCKVFFEIVTSYSDKYFEIDDNNRFMLTS